MSDPVNRNTVPSAEGPAPGAKDGADPAKPVTDVLSDELLQAVGDHLFQARTGTAAPPIPWDELLPQPVAAESAPAVPSSLVRPSEPARQPWVHQCERKTAVSCAAGQYPWIDKVTLKDAGGEIEGWIEWYYPDEHGWYPARFRFPRHRSAQVSTDNEPHLTRFNGVSVKLSVVSPTGAPAGSASGLLHLTGKQELYLYLSLQLTHDPTDCQTLVTDSRPYPAPGAASSPGTEDRTGANRLPRRGPVVARPRAVLFGP